MTQASSLLCILFLLTGCLYPEERLKENKVPYEAQLNAVQTAVDQFREDKGGIVPIKTRDMNTPLYQKYPIDFNKLIPAYLEDVPGNSYEAGGVYSYVLVSPEEDPTVKLIDVSVSQKIHDIHIRLDAYRQKHGSPPYAQEAGGGFYTLDYKKLGYEHKITVQSPYSGQTLPVLVNGKAELFVDYSEDLYRALQKTEKSYKKGDDIREVLVENSPFVPVFSPSFTVNNKGEPLILQN